MKNSLPSVREALLHTLDHGPISDRSDDESSPETIGPAHDSDSEEEYEPGIEIHEENDIPHPKNSTDLANWLKLSDAYLAALPTNAPPVCSPVPEPEISSVAIEHTGVSVDGALDPQANFSDNRIYVHIDESPSTVNTPSSESESSPAVSNHASSSRVTIEDVADEDDEYLTVQPIQLSPEAMAEDGLDDLPWDPSKDVSPRPTDSPMLNDQPPTPLNEQTAPLNEQPATSSLPLGAAAYFHHSQGFIMPHHPRQWKTPCEVPSNTSVDVAIQNLQEILHPVRDKGQGHKKANLDIVTTARLECITRFLRLYKASRYSGRTLHSETVATASGKTESKTWLGCKIREWAVNFCADKKNMPTHMYGRFNSSILSDEDIAGDIHLHLQSLGKRISAKDIVRYVATPEFQACLSVKHKISLWTAQRWMKKMGYRWKKEPKGMSQTDIEVEVDAFFVAWMSEDQ
ncbi:hypothetical protein DFH07DRAFT_768294 [Mycena maculata]|uniref:Uncharacterized protein n=1 Tax=Mycena maculata TaxID=230809 RepID=A0AAD7JVD6_9AGAR|nr:hypothetical protein DFH07DRAFT_768294 [Mycena maculata]